jgi:hypothetical protein
MGNGQRKTTLQIGGVDMPYGPTLVQQLWTKMDEETDKVMREGDGVDTQLFEAKCRARMMAEVLALFMVPHFKTPDECAHEAMRRHRAKKAGEEYETPGVGTQRYVPPPGTRRTGTTKPLGANVDLSPSSKISPSDLDTIKKLAAKKIPTAKIAQVMGMTEEEVNAVL